VARTRPFREESFEQLVLLIAARTPTPGGGTAAALAGALGAGLACMALRFSLKRKEGPAESDAVAGAVEGGLLDLVKRFEQLADADTDAFEAVRSARKLPQGSEAERAARESALATANAAAAEVPLSTLRLARDGLELIAGVTSVLNRNLATDAASGAILLRGGARCAALNVDVNLVGDGSERAAALRAEVARLLERCDELERSVVAWTRGVLGPA
jgi:formiminotetrahydrofolate cyclodeaminase